VSIQTSDRLKIEAAAVHLTPVKMNTVRLQGWRLTIADSQAVGLAQSDARKAPTSTASRRTPTHG
jgi:hypothetical protein